ncbi:MAG: pseudaminic acid cytidylyltransferase [Lachnospiraceae bacterium]
MKALAIITARGGSKRIPRKNVKPFLGKPIIEYSIAAALESGVFAEVMVSTDDAEIEEISRRAGAKVPFLRSEKTASDFATTAEVLLEVLQKYEEMGQTFDAICCIYPTAPFVTADTLRSAMELLENSDADTVLPVVKFSFPPQRCVVVKEGYLKPKWPEYMNCRSQDLEPFYHDCGQFYCMKTVPFLEQKKVVMEKALPYFREEMMVQDIDTEEDWRIAEIKYSSLQNP